LEKKIYKKHIIKIEYKKSKVDIKKYDFVFCPLRLKKCCKKLFFTAFFVQLKIAFVD